jgi:hypothetical protein
MSATTLHRRVLLGALSVAFVISAFIVAAPRGDGPVTTNSAEAATIVRVPIGNYTQCSRDRLFVRAYRIGTRWYHDRGSYTWDCTWAHRG